MSNENRDSLVELIERADKCRGSRVLLLLGPPGIGKTQAVHRFAKKHDRKVVTMVLSQLLPNEVAGMTMPNEDKQTMEIYDPSKFRDLKDGDVIFFDELLTANDATLNACLNLVREGELASGAKLPNVLIVAAANETRSPASVPVAIRQRFKWHNINWGREEWMNHIHDRFGIWLTLSFINNYVSFSADEWNVLTPRCITDYIEYVLSQDPDDMEWAYEDIASEVSRAFSNSLREQLESKMKEKQGREAIMAAIARQGGILMSEKEANYVMQLDAVELVRYLMDKPYWNDIKSELEGVKFE